MTLEIWKKYNIGTVKYITDGSSYLYRTGPKNIIGLNQYRIEGDSIVPINYNPTNINAKDAGSYSGWCFYSGGLLRISSVNVSADYVNINCYRQEIASQNARGSYIEDVIAKIGVYPDDGASGGYWYVKMQNFAPTIPTSVKCVTKEFAKKAITLSWIKSTDPNEDLITYNIDFYNGTSWISSIGNTAANNFDYILPDIAIKNAKFRVRAFDSKSYSAYTESNIFEICKISVYMNVNGEKKRFNEGYIKIDSSLKKVCSIWIKENNILKRT